MSQNWKTNGPLVIGGIGGSGTRLVTEICQSIGFNLGEDLNKSLDNLTYTLLFRRYHWYTKNQHKEKNISVGLDLLKKIIQRNHYFTVAEINFLLYATLDTYLHYRNERIWAFKRVYNIYRKPITQQPFLGWGWKEPNSYLLLPHYIKKFQSLKFIHIIRHGLDMAFSKNQRQMKNWGGLFFPDWKYNSDPSPADSLRFWISANKYIVDFGKSLGSDHYLQVNFDHLCSEPALVTNQIIDFLGINVDQKKLSMLSELPKPQATMGRYKDHDLSIFPDNDIQEVRRFGFQV